MPDVVLAHASPVDELLNSSQGPNTNSLAISVMIASNSTTARQAQGTPQPKGSLSYTVHPSTASLDAQGPGVNVKLESLGSEGADIEAEPVQYLIPGSQTIPATSDSQDHLLPDQTPFLVSSTVLGSGTSASAQAPLTSITHVLHKSDSTASLLSLPTASPDFSKQPSPLTISGQTVTANSFGRYPIASQTLTPGGVITVSGSRISLAPNASDLIIGTSTEALGPSVTAKLGSGPNGTEVQQFTGHALGARDGLWSSSMMLLVSFLLLLWI